MSIIKTRSSLFGIKRSLLGDDPFFVCFKFHLWNIVFIVTDFLPHMFDTDCDIPSLSCELKHRIFLVGCWF